MERGMHPRASGSLVQHISFKTRPTVPSLRDPAEFCHGLLARLFHQLSSRSATSPQRGLVETLRRLGDKARIGRATQAYLTVRRGARPSATQ